MDWITLALIAVGAFFVLGLVVATAWFLIARAAMKNFEKASKRMDEEFRNFSRPGRF